MMKPTLLILAAGMGSRYGGLKQLDQLGPNGEAIIDYSMYDAIRAGFGKIVFVVRPEIEEATRKAFEPKLKGRVDIDFVYQELDLVPEGISYNPERKKPWGTAHAVWVAREAVHDPFLVINADDFYGPEAYKNAGEYLMQAPEPENTDYCMIGYKVSETLSEHGVVSRGICESDPDHYLTAVVERTDIKRSNGTIVYIDNEGQEMELEEDVLVSMNIWGFKPSIFPFLTTHFTEFIKQNADKIKAEFYIPTIINELVRKDQARVKILPTHDQWFGVTYREDKVQAEQKLRKLIDRGVYPGKLWA